MAAEVSIILIGERAEQITGNCCRLGGDVATLPDNQAFAEIKDRQQQMGVLYRVVRRCFADAIATRQVTLVQVDPRNQLYLIAKLVRDVWRFRPGFRMGMRALFQCFSLPAVIVNGRLVSQADEIMTPDRLCHAIADILSKKVEAQP
ncbi:MAG: hypothetical protein KatS3mg105_0792 [Gemmatales bacterium]|nr:MAG: hypothetical protein KatS3mg105_0792 [Gemmatales bacterium]